MAYGIVHHFPGGTEQQYRATVAVVHPSDGGLPEGQLFHAAGATDDGWLIIAIHDSKVSWETFRDNTLLPKMQEGIEGGMAGPPSETAFEVAEQQSA
jgi:hypothetical protein